MLVPDVFFSEEKRNGVRRTRYLLLLHELGVGAVVYNIRPEDGRGQFAIDLFGIDVFQFSVENELIAIRSEIDGSLLAQENKSEDVTVLAPALDLDLFAHRCQPFDEGEYIPSVDTTKRTGMDPCHRQWYYPGMETSGTRQVAHFCCRKTAG